MGWLKSGKVVAVHTGGEATRIECTNIADCGSRRAGAEAHWVSSQGALKGQVRKNDAFI